MKVSLNYVTDYYPNCWTLDVSNGGIGIFVEFSAKPTKKQIRNVKRAVNNYSVGDFYKTYNIALGKMV